MLDLSECVVFVWKNERGVPCLICERVRNAFEFVFYHLSWRTCLVGRICHAHVCRVRNLIWLRDCRWWFSDSPFRSCSPAHVRLWEEMDNDGLQNADPAHAIWFGEGTPRTSRKLPGMASDKSHGTSTLSR